MVAATTTAAVSYFFKDGKCLPANFSNSGPAHNFHWENERLEHTVLTAYRAIPTSFGVPNGRLRGSYYSVGQVLITDHAQALKTKPADRSSLYYSSLHTVACCMDNLRWPDRRQ